jgi:hypothetical protein
MKPICSVDAPFRHVSDLIQVQTAPLHIIDIGECGEEGRAQVNSQNGLDTHILSLNVELGGRVMINGLREIHIKICSARIVMYSQRHVC